MSSAQPSSTNLARNPDEGLDALTVAIGASSRMPLLLLFTSAAIWAVVASAFALIASIKFHSPTFLASPAWLSYGRVRPASYDALIYGFGLQAALAVALWMIARSGRRPLIWSVLATVGGGFWNFGVTVGFVAILAGDSTGFEFLEMPGYAAAPLFVGWLLLGISALVTLHYRVEKRLHPAMWFVMAGLFWLSWIHSTATLLLLKYPVRGVTQSTIAWWFGQNLIEVCFGLFGLAVVFYFVARLSGRVLHSRYLALFAFWMLVLFVSWGGIPNTAPVPAWMPAASTVATVLGSVLLLSVAANVYLTFGKFVLVRRDQHELSFVLVGVFCFLLAGAMHIVEVLEPTQMLHFTWFLTARWYLQIYGFFALVLFGASYVVLPAIAPAARICSSGVCLQFWLSFVGIMLAAVPLAIGGLIQSGQFGNPNVPFASIAKSGTHFLRLSTVGELLLLGAHLIFLLNVIGVVRAVYLARLVPVYELATEDLFKAAGGKA